MTKQVSVWQLADDPEAYGDDAGKFILTSPDGEDEADCGIFDTADEASDYAFVLGWEVVPLTINETTVAEHLNSIVHEFLADVWAVYGSEGQSATEVYDGLSLDWPDLAETWLKAKNLQNTVLQKELSIYDELPS
jgi:hypothetical protein